MDSSWVELLQKAARFQFLDKAIIVESSGWNVLDLWGRCRDLFDGAFDGSRSNIGSLLENLKRVEIESVHSIEDLGILDPSVLHQYLLSLGLIGLHALGTNSVA